MKELNTFGESIRQLRESKKLTLREVSKEIGIDTSLLSKIEKDNRKPSKSFIKKIATFFDVNEKDLTINFLSDSLAYQLFNDNDVAKETLKMAEKKVKYFRSKKINKDETNY